MLHFGAVDYAATVWIDGATGGGTTRGIHAVHSRHHSLRWNGRSACEIVVRAEDDPADLAKPRGKQDWQLRARTRSGTRARPGSGRRCGWSGCPRHGSTAVRWTSSLERWEIGLEAHMAGRWREGLRLGVKLHLAATE